jgi:hypothetical protein
MRISAATFLLACAAPALAQEADIQKQLMQRQQQSDAFSLQLRQSQDALKVPPAARPALEGRQLLERLRLENVSEKQLLEVRPETPQALRGYERQKADAERRPLTIPAGGIIRPE